MPFDNFYKDEDDSKRRGWILGAMAVLFFPAFVFVSYVFDFNPINSAGSSSTTYMTPAVKVAESLCSYLPKPEKFVFVSKESFPAREGGTTLVLRYQSERGLEEIMPTFLVWFDSKGWKADPNANLTFRRNDQTITIGHNDAVSPNYEIYCSAKDEIISFGV
jgi:hypothetical protein